MTEAAQDERKGTAMSNDNWFGVEPPRDANGKAIPLDTETLYTKNGQVFQVGQFRYSVMVNRWFVYGHYEHGGKSWIDLASCFLLTPPDSWEKIKEDAEKTACRYFSGLEEKDIVSCMNCPQGRRTTDRRCRYSMIMDIVRRAKRLAGIEEQEGEL